MESVAKGGAVVNFHQVTVDVNPEVGIDPEQVLFVGGMVENTHRNPVVHDRLPPAVKFGENMGRVKQTLLRKSGERTAPAIATDHQLLKNRLMEPTLATPEAKGALGLLLNNPAFFPFQLPVITGDFVSQRSDRIDVVRYGLDDELLKLKSHST